MKIIESLRKIENQIYNEKEEVKDLVGDYLLLKESIDKDKLIEMISNNDVDGVVNLLESDFEEEDSIFEFRTKDLKSASELGTYIRNHFKVDTDTDRDDSYEWYCIRAKLTPDQKREAKQFAKKFSGYVLGENLKEDVELEDEISTYPWAFVTAKGVKDYDGFWTDYSMWREMDGDKATDHFVFIFGDNDLYTPLDSDWDWECDSKQEAIEWFDNYSGFEDDELEPELTTDDMNAGQWYESLKESVNGDVILEFTFKNAQWNTGRFEIEGFNINGGEVVWDEIKLYLDDKLYDGEISSWRSDSLSEDTLFESVLNAYLRNDTEEFSNFNGDWGVFSSFENLKKKEGNLVTELPVYDWGIQVYSLDLATNEFFYYSGDDGYLLLNKNNGVVTDVEEFYENSIMEEVEDINSGKTECLYMSPNLKSWIEEFDWEDIDESLTEKFAPDDYAPKKTGVAYKVFKVKNGKLYPPMVANVGGEDTPVGKWLEAEEGEFAGLSKTGRKQVKAIGGGNLSYRPGWHLGDVPRAPQFDRTNKQTGEKEFPKDFVWAKCSYTMDVDYQPESDEQGYMRTKVDADGNVTEYRSDKYQHSLAGLHKLPKDGYYKYRTNPRPDTVPWVITGAIKVDELLDDYQVNDILKSKGIEPIHRQGGDKTLAELGL